MSPVWTSPKKASARLRSSPSASAGSSRQGASTIRRWLAIYAAPRIGEAPAGTLIAYQAGAGLTYTIDILRLVPYFDVAVGILGIARPAADGTTRIDNQFGIQT